MVTVVNDGNYKEILKNSMPILLDIGATWCGPCQALAPIVDELAGEYDGRALVCKVDVDDSPEVAGTYRVRSVPTVLFIKDGEVRDKVVGLVAKSTLVDKLTPLL